MEWVRPGDTTTPVVSVLRQGEAKAAGAAALISRHRVLTCAHVINDALGRTELHCQDPPSPVDITVEFHGGDMAALQCRTARVSLWIPPLYRAPLPPRGDLAVLELSEAAPEWVTPVNWTEMTEGQSLRAWHGSGQQIAYADTEVTLCDGRTAYLDAPLKGAAIGPGYSGGPLWSRKRTAAVGLVVAHVMPDGGPFDGQKTMRRSRALPWQAVRDELVRAGAANVLKECSVLPLSPSLTPDQEDLLPFLWALLGDTATRGSHARALAQQLGHTVPYDYAPSVPELAILLSSYGRALATLTEIVAPGLADEAARTALTSLLLRSRLSGISSLLSLGEHRRLVAELREIVDTDPTLVPRAAREALRFTPLPEVLRSSALAVADTAAAVEALEELSDCTPVPDGTPQMPALLHLVECVAAAVGDPQGTVLKGWSERVAHRLGIHPSALAQRRADADRWAAHRSAPVSGVRVELSRSPSDPEDRYRCRVWLFRTAGTPTCLPSAKDALLSPEEVARLICEAVDGIQSDPAQGNQVPRVNVVVDRAGLHLPVDEWNPGRRNMFVPGLPIGAAFQLTLSCPEMSDLVPTRETEQRRRWVNGQGAPLVIDPDHGSDRQVAVRLQHSHRDTTQVVLHGPQAQRARLLELCLAMGVPVVLWDRTAESYEDASRLDPVRPTGPLPDLPERVRGFRGDVFGDPARHPARPSLVWEDTNPSPPTGLELMDPMEGAAPS